MRIDGKILADEIIEKLTTKVKTLREHAIIPTMAVILVGDDPGSASYVRQKEKAAERIGAELQVTKYELGVTKETVQEKINELNAKPKIHGIIIQRPLPKELCDKKLLNSIDPKKDIDGFVPGTPFEVPVAMAVNKILRKIYDLGFKIYEEKQFETWLKEKNIVIVGRGETAGKPIAEMMSKLNCTTSIITSKNSASERKDQLEKADIVISCVGKERIIQKEDIQKGVILISVGISRDATGKLHGDYEEDDIKDIAAYYTPTPGGVGPINVACLMENLIFAI